MTATPTPLALGDLFPNARGREYTLTWSNGTGKGQSGWIRMTDLLFNYAFLSAAFGVDGAYEERDVRGRSNVRMERRIGGPVITYSASPYKRKVVPTSRTNGYDTGKQFYYLDDKKQWNFEIGGRTDEFRLWLMKVGRNANLRRPFAYVSETGTLHSVTNNVIPLP